MTESQPLTNDRLASGKANRSSNDEGDFIKEDDMDERNLKRGKVTSLEEKLKARASTRN